MTRWTALSFYGITFASFVVVNLGLHYSLKDNLSLTADTQRALISEVKKIRDTVEGVNTKFGRYEQEDERRFTQLITEFVKMKAMIPNDTEFRRETIMRLEGLEARIRKLEQ